MKNIKEGLFMKKEKEVDLDVCFDNAKVLCIAFLKEMAISFANNGCWALLEDVGEVGRAIENTRKMVKKTNFLLDKPIFREKEIEYIQTYLKKRDLII